MKTRPQVTITVPAEQGKPARVERRAENRLRHYMREWRLSIGLNLIEMSAEITRRRGQMATPAQLSRVENGTREYRQDLLEAYAEVIGCTPGDLLSRVPVFDPAEVLQNLRSTAQEILRVTGGLPKK
jgi:transcriptional regulator with XRE-family HTH domain